jgi:hypothetical protein
MKEALVEASIVHTWTGAALFVALLSSMPAFAEDAKVEEGKRAFKAGVIFLQDPDGARYEEARVQFRKAWELTGNWKVLGNLGLCSLKLERDGEAAEAYEKYLAVGAKEIEAAERTQVERDLAALKAQLVHVKVQLPDASGTIVDQRERSRGDIVGNDYRVTGVSMELGLHPGHHVLRARLPRGEAKWEVDLEPGATVLHRFELAPAAAPPPPSAPPSSGPSTIAASSAPPPEPEPNSKMLAYVVGGVGVVGIGVGAVFGLQTLSKKSQRDEVCHDGFCDTPAGLDYDKDARSAATISTIGFGVGLVGVGVGAYLLLRPSSSGPARQAWWIAPAVGARSEGVQLGASF